ncbi:PRC-barrel domain-containing protein [Salinispira pacifica]
MLVKATRLTADSVRARDGLVGRVKDILFDDEAWVGRFMVVKTGPWIFGRQLLVSPLHIREIDSDRSEIRIGLTRAEAGSAPHLGSAEVVSRVKQREYEDYRHTPTYWGGSGLWKREKYPDAMPSVNVPQMKEQGDEEEVRSRRRNRSTREVSGYRAVADGKVLGRVVDFLVDPDNFAIRSLVVEDEEARASRESDGNGPARRIPVPVDMVGSIAWIDGTVRLKTGIEDIDELPDCGDAGC